MESMSVHGIDQQLASLHLDSGRGSGLPSGQVPFDGFGPTPGRPLGTTRTGLYRGAPFIPHPDFQLLGQGLDSRIVIDYPDSRVFFVERFVVGPNEGRNIQLLRCEQAYVADCDAFAYVYQGVVYSYGYHNHEL
jgi:hypothetical protein